MFKFIVATFAFLLWGFYIMSGGSDFDPQAARLTNVSVDPLKPSTASAEPAQQEATDVTRVALNLTAVDDVQTRRTRPADRLPQQQTSTQTADAPQQGESVRLIVPSLVAGADQANTAQPAATVEEQQPVVQQASFTDIRRVSGNRVNVRGGPGTNFGVVNKLVRGDEVEILEDDGSGWVRLRPIDGGPVGYMADYLLTEG